jgi:hypothetical protein
MASRASRSAGISRFGGLLAPAAELCRIARASYLSPSFPFFLCFELWRYLYSTRHGLRPRRKVTRGPAGSPSFLRLLRGAALAVTLMLPAEGWAQVTLPAAPSPPQESAVSQQDEMSTGNGPLFPRTTVKTGVTSEDPRYFRLGSGSFTHRFLYSAATTIWCKRDNGTWGPNYANVLGNFISGGISNA